MSLVAIVLAAGKGSRMRSPLPKVLHRLAGRTLVGHVLEAARDAGCERAIVVVGHQADEVERIARSEAGDAMTLVAALQPEQLGTGHAVLCALPQLETYEGPVVILNGDVPLLRPETLARMVAAARREGTSMSMLSFEPEDPTGYGRVVRGTPEGVAAIREERDASTAERGIGECNAGVYCVSAARLREHIPKLGTDNAQGEMYLTDLVEALAREGLVRALMTDALEVAGVNTPEQLAALERAQQTRLAES